MGEDDRKRNDSPEDETGKRAEGCSEGPTPEEIERAAPQGGRVHRDETEGAQPSGEGESPGPAVTFDGPEHEPLDFPIVAIGASAGGLAAIEEVLDHLPEDAGLTIVFVQHLSPEHKSSLAEILSRHTEMPVREASDGTRLGRNCVYVIPPDRDLAVDQGVLRLVERPPRAARHMPVDSFFRSLAEDQGPRTIGVVLSGTGTDGSIGLKAIKSEGGITLAQEVESAAYDGMPAAAASTGQVDFVLPPARIAEELIRIASHPRVQEAIERPEGRLALRPSEAIQKILRQVRQATGVDFSEYKQSTVERRIARRMVLRKADSLEEYLEYLRKTPGEVQALFDDMLISVTGFFRDPDVFEALKQRIFPKLVEDKDADTPIRVWVPACSTGEEAYSMAIVLLEYLTRHDLHVPIQIFATDISDSLIEKARIGRYPENIESDVSEDRLRRYFTRNGGQYQISKTIRDFCVFARQNAVKDPPFSKIDLLSCRNFLIYLGPNLQKRAIPTFHYALKPNGYLLLGGSESIGGFADLFHLIDREHKVYGKKQTATHLPPGIGKDKPTALQFPDKREQRPSTPIPNRDLEREADVVLLRHYAPPGAIVDGGMNILHFRGQTGRYLQPAPGAASLNLMRMARPELDIELRALLQEARANHRPARRRAVTVTQDSGSISVAVEVHPLGAADSDSLHFLVLFDEADKAEAAPAESEEVTSPRQEGEAESPGEAHKEIERLRRELRQTKMHMQNVIEEHESTNEELRAANEETQSANEELQSTNEELETAKEELQSTNEELSTVNSELESQNAEAARAIDDFTNLHNAVDIPVILLDKDLHIRTFTPPAERQFGLRDGDEGRKIRELNLGLQIENLEERIRGVLDTLNTVKEEVRSDKGNWYMMRIRPYRTAEDQIKGAVLAFVDITENRETRQEMYNSQILAESIVETVRQPLLVLDSELKVVGANPTFYEAFQVAKHETEGRRVYELGDGQWKHPDLRRLLEEIVPENTQFEGFEITHDFPKIGRRRAVLDGRRIEQKGDRPHLILLAVNELEEA